MSNKAGERLWEKSTHTCKYFNVKMLAKVKQYAVLLSYGLKSEAADKGVAKIFVKSSFEEQFTVATWPSKSLFENIEKL